jgi:hypothetical protein
VKDRSGVAGTEGFAFAKNLFAFFKSDKHRNLQNEKLRPRKDAKTW